MSDRPLILAVDRNVRNLELLAQFLGREGHTTLTAANLEDFDRLLVEYEIALALVDVAGFERDIWERCARLQAAQIPFLVVCNQQSAVLRQGGILSGARAVLVKPLVVQELLELIRGLLADWTPTERMKDEG